MSDLKTKDEVNYGLIKYINLSIVRIDIPEQYLLKGAIDISVEGVRYFCLLIPKDDRQLNIDVVLNKYILNIENELNKIDNIYYKAYMKLKDIK